MELVFKNGRAVAEDNKIGVTMLVTPREDIDAQGVIYRYFEYVANMLDSRPPLRVEWDIDSTHAVLPKETADFLVRRKYARDMREDEVVAYNTAETTQLAPTETPPTEEVEKAEPAKPVPRKAKRGE